MDVMYPASVAGDHSPAILGKIDRFAPGLSVERFNCFPKFNAFVLNTLTIDDHYIGAFTKVPFTTITCGWYSFITFYQFCFPGLVRELP